MQRRELMSTLVAAGAGGVISTRSTAAALSSSTAASISTKAVDTHFVQARDGTRLYWTQWGAGRPIAFADRGHRCIAFDRRGHGRSDRPLNGYDYDTFADDVASLITALDLQEITVVAHSMGGGEIVRYLTRHGSARVARVVGRGAVDAGFGADCDRLQQGDRNHRLSYGADPEHSRFNRPGA